ncbi:ATP-dependent DNA helicase RecG [candidate division Kazan bacterium]|uniref:Probable DNA 3'-5' helicase RecG n=1 Tax=candidate division Kazan bacterium TaxID=2202143 RepID=A0A420ZCU3_UNCK3|nr:MAG: ATP-dependent DNA helicase RecG [candidate division Kazan bacterium]
MAVTTLGLQSIPYVGPKIAEILADLNIKNIDDLIYYFPRAWEDLSQIIAIADLVPSGDKFTIRAKLAAISTFRSPIKRMYLTQARAVDDSGQISLIWFNQPYLRTSLKKDKEYFFTGKVDKNRNGLQMINPNFETVSDTPLHSGRIIPVYPEHKNISSKMFRRIMKGLVKTISQWPEILPAAVVKKYKLLPLNNALTEIHFPMSLETLQTAKDRLAFDELLTTQLTIQQIKNYLKKQAAHPIPTDVGLVKKVLEQLPFKLTDSQKQALWEILQDISQKSPASRLLEGDVGSGKTIVVAIAMIAAKQSGFQSAMMAPTEVLANQHFDKLKPLFDKMNTTVALRTNAFNKGPGDADIVIGTHALIYNNVQFKNLNLVVIDEQHRFGVKQREALKHKTHPDKHPSDQEFLPHFISLTATPIPRSLALGIFGDLDISIIASKPSQRPRIITQVLTEKTRKVAYQKILEEVKKNHQAFIVAPLIKESKTISAKSVEQEFEHIKNEFPNVKVGLLHGGLDAVIKQKIMKDFESGKIKVLVSTTVIEVGIDIPNATVISIESAERFGLAQMHQLRGRVGRSDLQSYCYVIPSLDDELIIRRLEEFAKLDDGFKLAELDLKTRGPGALFGQLQAGFIKYKLADWTNTEAIKIARNAAREMLEKDPELTQSPMLASRININDAIMHRE